MKIIIESILFTRCETCYTIKEHRAEVHSSIHFEGSGGWRDDFDAFCHYIKESNYNNFHEAYMAYLHYKETIK